MESAPRAAALNYLTAPLALNRLWRLRHNTGNSLLNSLITGNSAPRRVRLLKLRRNERGRVSRFQQRLDERRSALSLATAAFSGPLLTGAAIPWCSPRLQSSRVDRRILEDERVEIFEYRKLGAANTVVDGSGLAMR